MPNSGYYHKSLVLRSLFACIWPWSIVASSSKVLRICLEKSRLACLYLPATLSLQGAWVCNHRYWRSSQVLRCTMCCLLLGSWFTSFRARVWLFHVSWTRSASILSLEIWNGQRSYSALYWDPGCMQWSNTKPFLVYMMNMDKEFLRNQRLVLHISTSNGVILSQAVPPYNGANISQAVPPSGRSPIGILNIPAEKQG